MGGFAGLILALIVFLAAHILPAATGLRRRLTAALGEGPYIAAYSVLSLVLLGWVIWEVIAAPYVPLWQPEAWTHWVPVYGMPVACLLLVAGVSQANPLSIRIRPGRFDPERPGVLAITRHPIVLAFTLWAALHIPPNGDLAATGLFAAITLFGLLGTWRLDRKRRRQLGEAEWARLAGRSSAIPFAALVDGRAPRALGCKGITQIILGLGLYGALFRVHAVVPGIDLRALLGL